MSEKSYSVCVLLSGGLDSAIAWVYAKKLFQENATALFVDYGQPYVEKEKKAITKIAPDCVSIKVPLCGVFDLMPTPQKQEVYGRNLLLAFYGAQLAPNVWLSSLYTEMNSTAVPDKRPEFFEGASNLLSLVLENKYPNTGVVLTSPFRDITKSELIRLALTDLGLTPDFLLSTVSCYEPSPQNSNHCGACSTCFKRWIAMTNNGIEEQYDVHPLLENAYAKEMVNKMQKCVEENNYTERFTRRRVQETFSAIEKIGLDPLELFMPK